MIKYLVFSCAALAVLLNADSVQAADLPRPAPKYESPAAVAMPSWTGFYLGLSIGGRSTNTDWTTNSVFNAAQPVSETSPAKFDSTNARVGGYLGYNFQFAPRWVAGIEGDIAYAKSSAQVHGFPGIFLNGAPGTAFDTDIQTVDEKWDASVRGRLGFLVTPDLMAYGTGGVAWQQVATTAICNAGGASSCKSAGASGTGWVETTSQYKTGWTIGGGLEYKFLEHWLARTEYRYADYGTLSHTYGLSNTLGGANNHDANVDLRLRTHTFIFGVAYQF